MSQPPTEMKGIQNFALLACISTVTVLRYGHTHTHTRTHTHTHTHTHTPHTPLIELSLSQLYMRIAIHTRTHAHTHTHTHTHTPHARLCLMRIHLCSVSLS